AALVLSPSRSRAFRNQTFSWRRVSRTAWQSHHGRSVARRFEGGRQLLLECRAGLETVGACFWRNSRAPKTGHTAEVHFLRPRSTIVLIDNPHRVARELQRFLSSRRRRSAATGKEPLAPAVAFALERLRRRTPEAGRRMLAESAWRTLGQHLRAR